ncbi:mitochondrial enolase superfamily member 1 isoform X1 [Harpegnathos saltator]|uniref:Mitochondrial enolase superfamily member 1 n=1 Tax=Harpegnathos saltator TaxID=610380 RepID=E2BEE0_HARSA|nr:mitochondrial enolase superfamily member 1 isoform X1 [Harpegnathos saltator]EFN85985.1 Mitochondrial enolase superfamily member 1 [Harpegnathos saltator]
MIDARIIDIDVKDIRFPTSLLADGSDAMHTDPDYSCAYVTIKTDQGYEGYGLTFTLGRGTEVVVQACRSMFGLVKNQTTTQIYGDFASFWRKLTSESQLRWIGPEKGVIHLATAAIINALWDLWARIEDKPVWKLLTDLTPEQLVSTVDFRYITDMVTKEEVIDMLRKNEPYKKEREELLRRNGYPAYTTQVGWLGYSDQKVKDLCAKYLRLGFTRFKVKVGQNLEDDVRRCRLVREVISYDNKLMLDANQIWDVNVAIEWMDRLTEFKPFWIEEPTSPDDILGHAMIAAALRPHGIAVATGEMCANRVLFKQLLQMRAINICQIDSARIGGINEILSVYFMAEKTKTPVWPHAGGVGLCEMVQHLQMWAYICLSSCVEDCAIEFVDQQHEHFVDPVLVENASYKLPTLPGYSTKLKDDCILNYTYPEGKEWK